MNIIDKTLFNHCIEQLKDIDKLWIKRKRKIDTLTIFYYLLDSAITNKGLYTFTKINNHFSHVSLIKARKKLPIDIFYNLNFKINQTNPIKNHIYAIDGSKIRVHTGFTKYGYKTRTNDKDVKRKAKRPLAMLSSLHGINSDTTINYCITKHFNERKTIEFLIKDLPKGSIVIMDRGYFSLNVYGTFLSHKINCIMRLKKDANKHVHKFYKSKNNVKIVNFIENNKFLKIKLIKYYIDNNLYIIGTSLINSTLNQLKKYYKMRWRVEISFKRLKSHLNINKIHSRTENLWLQELQFRILIDSISHSTQKQYVNIKSNNIKYIHTYVYIVYSLKKYVSSLYYIFNYHQSIT